MTSSKPEKKFSITTEAMADEIMHNKSFLILVGLGRKGLPKDLFSLARYHLDITSQGVSLETCTAIGCIPSYLMGIVHAKSSEK